MLGANSLKESFACPTNYLDIQDEGADFVFLCTFATSFKIHVSLVLLQLTSLAHHVDA